MTERFICGKECQFAFTKKRLCEDFVLVKNLLFPAITIKSNTLEGPSSLCPSVWYHHLVGDALTLA